MGRFTVGCYDSNGIPVNAEGDSPLPSVDAETPIEAAQTIRGLPLSDAPRAPRFRRAEVWPYGKPDEKIFLYEQRG